LRQRAKSDLRGAGRAGLRNLRLESLLGRASLLRDQAQLLPPELDVSGGFRQ
jgi:hypothetical protein